MAEIQNIRYGDTGLVPPEYNYTFEITGSFSAVRVQVRLLGQIEFNSYVEGVQYTHTPSTNTILFLAGFEPQGDGQAPIDGFETSDTIILSRFTTRDRQVDFQEGSTIKSQTLDNDANRLTAVTQEIEGAVTDALKKNAIGSAWNAESLPAENSSPALRGDGWPTLAQVQGLIGDAPVSELIEPKVFTFVVPAGGQAQFEMIGVKGVIAGQPTVWVNGVIQRSDSGDYTTLHEGDAGYPPLPATQGDDYLTFAVALVEDSVVHVRLFTGTVLGVLADEFLNDPDQISDNLIGLQHINVGVSAEDDRFMVFDSLGDPVAERIGLQHLKATGQVLDPQSLLALNNATTGLSLDGFLRAPTNPVNVFQKAIINLFVPVGVTAQPGDAVSRTFVEGLFGSVSNPQLARGEVDPDDIPNEIDSSFTIPIGFAPDLFFMMAEAPAGAQTQYGSGWWLRGGTSNQKLIWMTGFQFGTGNGSFGSPASRGNYFTSSSGSDMLIVQSKFLNDTPAGTKQASPYIQLLWFALKF